MRLLHLYFFQEEMTTFLCRKSFQEVHQRQTHRSGLDCCWSYLLWHCFLLIYLKRPTLIKTFYEKIKTNNIAKTLECARLDF